MGNICSPCCSPSSSSKGRSSNKALLSSPYHDSSNSISNTMMDDYDDFKTIISAKSNWEDDIWYDALMEHDGEATFDVSDEELQILKQHLITNFPGDDADYMSDAYLKSVASKPYSKDMSIRRPLEYTIEKLTHVMEWRQEMKAPQLVDWIRMIHKGDDSNNNMDPTTLDKANKLVESLNNGSMYFHGHTKDGRPILWIRTNRKYWYPNVEAEVNALIAIADVGIRFGMPKNSPNNNGVGGGGVTDFCCISHSHKPPPPNPKFAYKMLQGLVKGYPDRMHLLISAPVSSIVEFCMNLLLPLMPGRLSQKFVFLNMENAQERLEELLFHGKEDIPTFFGGPADHDEYYPEEKLCNKQRIGGSGKLKFDFFGMMERLQQQTKDYEEEMKFQQLQQNSKKHVSFSMPSSSNTGLLLPQQQSQSNGTMTTNSKVLLPPQ